MTGKSQGTRPKCQPGCECGKHPVQHLTTQQCFDRAEPLGQPGDFEALAAAFGFANAHEARHWVIRQQWRAEGFVAVSAEVIQ